MISASSLDRSFSTWLGQVQKWLDLDGMARRSGAIQRARKIASGADLLRLALTFGPGGCSLRETALRMSALGGVISDTAVTKRLARAGAFLETLLTEMLRAAAPSPALPASHRLVLVDATVINAPRSPGCDWRLHCRYSDQRFEAFELTDQRGGEQLDRFDFAPGDIVIADRGYRGVPSLVDLRAAGADFVLRAGWQSFAWRDADGKPVALPGRFDHVGPDAIDEAMISLAGPRGLTLPTRVIAFGQSLDAGKSARGRARDKARRQGHTLHPSSLDASRHLYLVTSLPKDEWPAERIVALYRVRWQIELAFKRLKSILRIDRLTSRDPGLARSWIIAHLIAAVMMQNLAGPRPATPTLGPSPCHAPCGAT